jgi:hypothetical protein
MSADKHPTMKCPFCSWSSRTYNASAHFLKHHSAKIHIRPVTNDHCLYAYVVHDKEEIDFCGCLTCGKGTLGDGNFGNSSRWIEMHSKNKACKVHHRKKLADLRESIRVATMVPAPPTEAPTVTPAAPAPILHSVWASLKKNKPFVPFMEDVEVFCKMCNDDSDDDFDPKEAFEHSIRCAVSDRNNISQHKTEMNKIESEHDTVVANMQYDIKQLKQQVAGLQDYINDQAKRTSDLERRLALLERENKRYKAVYPELPAEDPQ